MAHWKMLLNPSEYLGAQDFPEPKEVVISRVVREEAPTRDEDDDKTGSPKKPPEMHPVMYIVGRDGNEYPRRLKMPKTVLYGLSHMLGPDYDKWAGQKVTIYATKCKSFGEIEECVRIKFDAKIIGKIKAYCKKRKVSFAVFECQQ